MLQFTMAVLSKFDKNGTGNSVEGVINGRVDVRSGRPQTDIKETVAGDRRVWNMNCVDPSDRVSWRNGLRTAMKRPHPLKVD